MPYVQIHAYVCMFKGEKNKNVVLNVELSNNSEFSAANLLQKQRSFLFWLRKKKSVKNWKVLFFFFF